MAGGYKRIYIGVGTTVVGILMILQMVGVQITAPDVICTDMCEVEITLRNPTAKSIYFYNKDEVKLDFSPDVIDYKLEHKYYGKWRTLDFSMENRPTNIPDSAKYVYVIPRYSTKTWKLTVTKEDYETIKWGIDAGDSYLDPLLKSPYECDWEVVKGQCIDYAKENISITKCIPKKTDCAKPYPTLAKNGTSCCGIFEETVTSYPLKCINQEEKKVCNKKGVNISNEEIGYKDNELGCCQINNDGTGYCVKSGHGFCVPGVPRVLGVEGADFVWTDTKITITKEDLVRGMTPVKVKKLSVGVSP